MKVIQKADGTPKATIKFSKTKTVKKRAASKKARKPAPKKNYVIARLGMKAYFENNRTYANGSYAGKIIKIEKDRVRTSVLPNFSFKNLITERGKLIITSIKDTGMTANTFIRCYGSKEPRTPDLSLNNKKHLQPTLIKYLKTRIGRNQAVNNHWICRFLTKQTKVQVNYRTVQFLINDIRKNALVPLLIASSEGYFVAKTKTEAANYLRKLNATITDLQQIENALFNQVSKKYNRPTVRQTMNTLLNKKQVRQYKKPTKR